MLNELLGEALEALDAEEMTTKQQADTIRKQADEITELKGKLGISTKRGSSFSGSRSAGSVSSMGPDVPDAVLPALDDGESGEAFARLQGEVARLQRELEQERQRAAAAADGGTAATRPGQLKPQLKRSKNGKMWRLGDL